MTKEIIRTKGILSTIFKGVVRIIEEEEGMVDGITMVIDLDVRYVKDMDMLLKMLLQT